MKQRHSLLTLDRHTRFIIVKVRESLSIAQLKNTDLEERCARVRF